MYSNVGYSQLFYSKSHASFRGDDTQKSKDLALTEARVTALMNVIYNITTSNHYQDISDLIDTENAYIFEQSINIKNENIANQEYSSDVIFSFNSEVIYNFLDSNKIPYVKAKGLSYLIVPRYYENGKEVLISQWNDIWLQTKPEDFLSNFIYYSPPNSNFITGENKQLVINDLKTHLDINDVFAVILTKTKDNLYNMNVINYATNAQQFFSNISSIEEAQYKATRYIEEPWKLSIIKRNNAKSINETFIVSTSNYENWANIDKKLRNMTEIKEFIITEINPTSVKIHIKQNESLADFQITLKKYCILLDSNTLNLDYDVNCRH
jgi:hypothetical protein